MSTLNSDNTRLFREGDDIAIVTVADVITVEDIDKKIEHYQTHIDKLKKLRENVVHMTNDRQIDHIFVNEDDQNRPSQELVPENQTATPSAPVAEPQVAVNPAGDAAASVPASAANADQGQAPAQPAVQAPNADQAAFNNAQVNPAAASNPTAPVEQPGLAQPQPQIAAAPSQEELPPINL